MLNNTQTIFLVPKAGLLVLNPDTGKPLAAGGERLPKTVYWRRRLLEGSVSEGQPVDTAAFSGTAYCPSEQQPQEV